MVSFSFCERAEAQLMYLLQALRQNESGDTCSRLVVAEPRERKPLPAPIMRTLNSFSLAIFAGVGECGRFPLLGAAPQ
jgi:hypothetical protein